MEPKPGELVLAFSTSEDFERWLAKHHVKTAVVWIKYAKKGSGEVSIRATEAVDVALCFGWIDGQSRSLDERYYLQRFTPRRSASMWSKINRDRVARLVEAGRMRPAGLAEVDRAKADGRWDAAYDSPKTSVVPAELVRALARSPVAEAAFAALGAAPRYSILHRLQTTKQASARARQIEALVAKLEAAEVQAPRPPVRATQAKREAAASRAGGRKPSPGSRGRSRAK